MLLLAAFGLLAGAMLAMSANPALAQEGQEPQQGLYEPEQATFTGVLQSEENRFVFSKFFLVDEQYGGVYTLKDEPLDESEIDLSKFVGDRVSVRVVPMNLDTPASSEKFNSTPTFVTSLEVLGEGSTQDQYAEEAPAEDPPAQSGSNGVPNVACSELGDSGEQAQQRAREALAQNPSDPNGLDADGDGIPCEFVEAPGEISYEDGSVIFITTAGSSQAGDTSGDQYDAPVADEPTEGDTPAEQPVPEGDAPADQPVAAQVTVLPDTGGASLFMLGAGTLLVAGGLLARRIVR